jgi:hypothetical protein
VNSGDPTQNIELLRQKNLMILPPNWPAEIVTASRIDKPIAQQTTNNIYPDYSRCLKYFLFSGKCLSLVNIFVTGGRFQPTAG